MFNNVYPENRGITQLIGLLNRLGYEVDVLSKYSNENVSYSPLNNPGQFCVFKTKSIVSEVISKSHLLLNYRALRHLKKVYPQREWDIVIVRETPLVKSCIAFGKEYGIPYFLDMRENRPDMISCNGGLFHKIYSWTTKRNEQKHIRKFQHITTVSDSLKKWTIANYQVPPHTIRVLGNYPSSLMLEEAEKFAISDYSSQDHLKIVFAGYVGAARGLQHVLPAMKILKQNKQKVTLTIIGMGSYITNIRRQSEELGINDIVILKDLVDPNRLMETLSKYDVGLASYVVNNHTNVTIPGKLFEYMAVGLPVLSSSRKSVVKILSDYNCGLVYKSQNPREISSKIMMLLDDEYRKHLGISGRKAIRNKFNESENIIVIRNILSNST